MIALRIRISQVRLGHAKDPLSELRESRGSVAKLLPVVEPAAGDAIVDCRKRPVRMVQVTVQHANGLYYLEWDEGMIPYRK